MIHAEQGERVQISGQLFDFSVSKRVLLFLTLFTDGIAAAAWNLGGFKWPGKRGIYSGVWHTEGWGCRAWLDTLWHEGVNGPWHDARCRRILWHSMDRNFSAAVWEKILSLQGDALRLRLLFSLQSQRDVAHQPYVATARGGEGQREELQDKRLQGPCLLDRLLLSPLKYFRGRFIFNCRTLWGVSVLLKWLLIF